VMASLASRSRHAVMASLASRSRHALALGVRQNHHEDSP